ncbi:MAG: alpha/beta fold hydrolase [Gammaproteobacteria bacterium]|nr:alpha/beta fold hydrolase [Gammaproteobacteria bacterium]
MSIPDPPSVLSENPVLSGIIDALLTFAIDPVKWEPLMAELEAKIGELDQMDAGEFLLSLSRAESLSWQLKHEGDSSAQASFYFLLIDAKDRAVAFSEHFAQLSEFIQLKGAQQQVVFANNASRASYEYAKQLLFSREQAPILVELSDSRSGQHRYGYLVVESDFPMASKFGRTGAVVALLIAQDEPSKKLRRVFQASFGLTASEAAVANSLASHLTLKETAVALGISVNTARNHLQAVFDKSGIKRQSDLVLVMTQMSVILAATESQYESSVESRSSSSEYPEYQFVILQDGRRLAYRAYGDPGDHAVVYFHENIGSSRLLPGTDEKARSLRLWIIAVERPGFGFSDPDANYSFQSVARDLQVLMDRLQIAEVSMLGFASGAGHALTCACEISQRVSLVLLVGGRPPEAMRSTGALKSLGTVQHGLVRQPWLLTTFFNILRNRVSRATNTRLIKRVYGAVSHDRAYLESHPQVLAHMVECTMESMTVGPAGVVNELRCYDEAPAFDLDRLCAPVTIWHGDADVLSTVDDIQAFLGDKVQNTRIFEGSGALVINEYWDAVLDHLADETS